ncbi:GPI mannosyltransferase 1 [Exophiala mesophila]|uniref:GPI mannosyltransferase 1 n=1 Tax=Exophiala mesophila TaxID=212818 RepID=A0A438N9A6_EXOME|nr:GPI mannosyltransferase 1 [Exophiala mesophila]
MSLSSSFFSSPTAVFTSAFLIRAILLVYGIYQDSVSALKYTDIDYYVFTDAARAVSRGLSPYHRDTYRYTPLLAWILFPTTWGGLSFHFGKALFAFSDLIAGWLLLVLLRNRGLDQQRALKYASVWLLNPMVANISTRGSSEGFLCVLVLALLAAFESKQLIGSAILLGICVHLKIYPFIYGASMLWTLESTSSSSSSTVSASTTPAASLQAILHFFNAKRFLLLAISTGVFMILNTSMYYIYGRPFLQHTFFHHLTRIDHRHNFSPYNTLLYLSSATHSSTSGINGSTPSNSLSFESLAFIPQLVLSTILLPITLSKHDLPTTMLAQTLAFVTFNKVCTSQYFLWYLIFLPLYLPNSSLVARPKLGITALALWVLGQAAWLQQGYQLEFLGRSTFVPGLFGAGLGFFLVNCWILGMVVQDVLVNSTGGGGDDDGQSAEAKVPK